MICAADSGPMARITIPDMIRFSHAKSGMRAIVMPGHRMHTMVVMMLAAVPMLPNPDTSRLRVQKSVLWPGENVRDVSGAYANQPTSGALPAP